MDTPPSQSVNEITPPGKFPCWFWDSNDDPWGGEEPKWYPYTDVENLIIERDFKGKLSSSNLLEYEIDFEQGIQQSLTDPSKQRRVKRMFCSQQIRQDRFQVTNAIRSRSFLHSGMIRGSFFISNNVKFHGVNIMLAPYQENLLPELTHLAADGLLKVADPSVQRETRDAGMFAKYLQDEAAGGNWKTIGEVCVKIYTCGSFLFNLANRILYDSEFSAQNETKRDFLAPYIALLHYYLMHADYSTDLILYRGCNLELEAIAQYRACIGKEISWESFVSTSRSFAVACMFSKNSVFRIHAFRGVDIASLSQYPDEEEVLLPIHSVCVCEGVTYDETEQKYIIDIRQLGSNEMNSEELGRSIVELSMSLNDGITPDEREKRLLTEHFVFFHNFK